MAGVDMPQRGGGGLTERRLRDVLKKSETDQEELRSFVRNRNNFSEEERLALNIDSCDIFRTAWNITLDAQERFNENHEHGMGLAARRGQEFGALAYDILQHVEPIVNLVKDLAAPYGGLAVGTVCFLFTLAKNRSKMERNITSTLEQIRDRVAGLKVYQHIYNDKHELDQQLQDKVVQTYHSFIDFCIVATKYYTKGSIRNEPRHIACSNSFKALICIQDDGSKLRGEHR